MMLLKEIGEYLTITGIVFSLVISSLIAISIAINFQIDIIAVGKLIGGGLGIVGIGLAIFIVAWIGEPKGSEE